MRYQFMCKSKNSDYKEVDKEAMFLIMGDDDEFDKDHPNYEKLFEKDSDFFQGFEVTWGQLTCKIVEVQS